MEQKRTTRILVCLTVLILLVVVLLVRNSLPRNAHIIFPSQVDNGAEELGEAGGEGALVQVEITPETVQSAIATLHRPESYRRAVTLDDFWSGGSVRSRLQVAVSGAYTRTDEILVMTTWDNSDKETTQPAARNRHTITNGEDTWIWYGSSAHWTKVAAGGISADDEQRIPTYEDILTLDPSQIAAADYRDLSGVSCIFVETVPDEAGYVLRYWVNVENGLLAAAEKLVDGNAVYHMASLALDEEEPGTADFTLPDGWVLLELPK